jgi:hypothetical protein
MTRSLCSGTPVTIASISRRMCGIWVEDHIVKLSPEGWTTTARGSMKAGMSRCWTNRRLTTTSAFAKACSVSSATPFSPPSKTKWKLVLDSMWSCVRAAPAAIASSMSSTGGSTS